MRTNRSLVTCAAVVFTLIQTGCGNFFPSENDIDSLELSPTYYFMVVGENKQFTATATTVGGDTVDASSSSIWSSSSALAAKVDSNGNVSATSSGSGMATTTIKATDGGVSDSTTVTITATTLTTVTVSPSSVSLKVGSTKQLGASGKFLDNASYSVTSHVKWTSSDTSIATVSSGGVVAGVAAGSATITATGSTSETTVTDSASITVSSS